MSSNPKAATLWSGAILGTVVKSIATLESADCDWMQYWSGGTYVVQGGDGRNGAVAFLGPQGAAFEPGQSLQVGAFYSVGRRRGPRVGEGGHAALEAVFRNCPDVNRRLAEAQVFPFMLYEMFPGGPCATAAFWNEGEYLAATEPWADVLDNGADLIRIQLIEDLSMAFTAWGEDYDLDDARLQLAESIYERKMRDPGREIRLSAAEGAYLASISSQPQSVELCRKSFSEIGVVVP